MYILPAFKIMALFAFLIIRTFQLIFSAGIVFFSHNKSVGTVFRLVFSAKRTGPIRCFGFSKYIVFTININNVYIQVHNKSYMSGTNTRVPEEEELMTINIDSSEQSRARLRL